MIARKHRRTKKYLSGTQEVSLTPLIDTALVLLVIFMVATPMLHNAIKVDLPKGQAQETQAHENLHDIVIYIDKQERIFLNETPVATKQDLINLLHEKIGSRKDQTVFVNGDGDISYKTLVSVVDTVKYLGGVEHVVLSTEKPV